MGGEDERRNMITINVVEIVNKAIAWISTLGVGGLIVFGVCVGTFSKKILNALTSLAIIAILFWFLSDTGRLQIINDWVAQLLG